jgi:hypothetical protein
MFSTLGMCLFPYGWVIWASYNPCNFVYGAFVHAAQAILERGEVLVMGLVEGGQFGLPGKAT